ncbi:ATP-dependent DNA helicase DDX11-like isoform X2 [Halichondria panicea]|uniref:ATP-dependent DNA helicase DDX11-like isoform X2 n=1 Tax=Halichondria panicea TaxID=6063 RepID=UPI00312B9068
MACCPDSPLPSTSTDLNDLKPPAQFPFPFEPYDIQRDFMRELYLALEGGKIGIFESPTGTGKSLSLICGALQWLLDHEQREAMKVEAVLSGSLSPSALDDHKQSGCSELVSTSLKLETSSKPAAVPDWFADYGKQKTRREAVEEVRAEQVRKTKREARLKKLKEQGGTAQWRTKRKREDSPTTTKVNQLLAASEPTDDNDVVLDEYFSDDEKSKQELIIHSSDEEDDLDEDHVKKIYYCSRTHTQLAQFVREVQHSPYKNLVNVITIGSRQNLCINEDVTRLKSLTLMNDRCLELQKNRKKEKTAQEAVPVKKQKKQKKLMATSCRFYKAELIKDFRDLALIKVQDIEQLVGVGRQLKACPYYGVRRGIPAAQLVALPYNTLLHAHTRDSVGVRLRGNVVIIDEAHNLLDTITNVYSVEVNGLHVSKAFSQLSQYMQRYRSRLKAKNLMYINQLLHVLNCFLNTLGSKGSDEGVKKVVKAQGEVANEPSTQLMRLNDFLLSSSMDNINFFKILRYCQKSQISKKLNGFVERYFEPGGIDSLSQMKSPLMLIESFFEALTSCDKDCRIVLNKSENVTCSSLKFILLNPAVHFSPIVQEARAVIMTGGTMQPVSEFKHQLLLAAGVSPMRIMEFSCGHVIPADHLLPVCLCKGPAGVDLEFTFQHRNNPALLDELGRALVNLCTVVPGGIVVFFPSYDYEKRVHTHWEEFGVLNRIGKKKKIFREPKISLQVDFVLSQYGKCIEVTKGSKEGLTGALMLCVVGGKLSEGINFSNDLGRCIVMVGLPYPNLKSPELKEKIEYLNSTQIKHPNGQLPGQVHYENLCMKAVNQSIGRSIRHSRDYATIILADKRYARSTVQRKLPDWISGQLQVCEKFGPAFAAVRKFFAVKKCAGHADIDLSTKECQSIDPSQL